MKYLKLFENFEEESKEILALKDIQNLGEVINHGDKKTILINDVKFRIYAEQGQLLLASIISVNKDKGNARLAMSKILEILDKYNVKMELIPLSMDKEGLDDTNLKNWYKRLGFVEGYENIMIRYPKIEP